MDRSRLPGGLHAAASACGRPPGAPLGGCRAGCSPPSRRRRRCSRWPGWCRDRDAARGAAAAAADGDHVRAAGGRAVLLRDAAAAGELAAVQERGTRRRGVPALARCSRWSRSRPDSGVWQALFRSEQVFVASDPGIYLQYGYWIAEHGTARIPASAGRFGGPAGWTSRPPGSSCPATRSRRRTCRGCRWCWPAGPGWAALAARC